MEKLFINYMVLNFIIFLIINQMNSQCNKNCTVSAFEDLYMCRDPKCFQPSLRCKDCFKYVHRGKGEDNKPSTHEYEKFNETIECRNLVRLIKIEEYITDKIKKSMGQFKTNLPGLSSAAFFQSQLVSDLFSDLRTRNQYAFFREVFYNRPMPFPMSPSTEFMTGLTIFNDGKFDEIKAVLMQGSPEEEMMNYSFNLISGSDSSSLENFIIGQQNFFSEYCSKLEKQQKSFQIDQYLKYSDQREEKHPIYYKNNFINFLEDKYSKNPGSQEIFTLAEYSRYIWKNFSYNENDEEISTYLSGEVELYRAYSKFVQGENVKERLLGFRMWRTHAAPSYPNIKNKYFLDAFISAYIQYLIDEKYWEIGKPKAQTWKDYAQYLRDYVAVVENKSESYVDLAAYRKYFDFRKEYENFFSYLKNAKEIIFNRVYATEYINKVFIEDGKVSKKNYKAFIEQKDLKQEEQIVDLTRKIESLRKELEQKEGQSFYNTIFEDFLVSASQMQLPLTPENYFIFKQQVLQDVNEDFIRQQNQRIMLQKKRAEEMPKPQPLKQEIKMQVTEVEQQLHRMIDKEQQSESEQDAMQVCMCCGGESDDCAQPECQMMGYCVNCCL